MLPLWLCCLLSISDKRVKKVRATQQMTHLGKFAYWILVFALSCLELDINNKKRCGTDDIA